MDMRTVLATLGTMSAMLVPAVTFAQDAGVTAESNTSVTSNTHMNFLQSFIDFSVTTGTSWDQGIDVAALRAHPCFDAVGAEQDYCLNMFGVDSDFSTMLETNVITRSMVEQALNQRCNDFMMNTDRTRCMNQNTNILPGLLIDLGLSSDTASGGFGGATGGTTTDNDDDMDEDVDTDEGTSMQNQYARSQRLWEMCAAHEMSQSGCYQTHLRFISDQSVTAEEMDEVIGNGRNTNNDDENEEEDEDEDDEADDTDDDGDEM
jgi:hypothetical protein